MFGRLKNWLSKQREVSNTRCTPAMLEYRRQVRDVVRECYPVLSRHEVLEVEHLIDHNELAEALLTLAVIIANKQAMVTRDTISSIRTLIDGFAEAEFLPENLDAFAIDQK